MLNHIQYLFQQHRGKRVQMLNWHACSPGFSPTENIGSIMKYMAKKTQDCWAAIILYETRTGPRSALLSSHTFTECSEKRKGHYTDVIMPLSFLRCVAPIKNTYFLKWYIFSVYQYLLLWIISGFICKCIWYLQIIILCFYLHFSQCPQFCKAGFVHVYIYNDNTHLGTAEGEFS